jgi:hypothetical protein
MKKRILSIILIILAISLQGIGLNAQKLEYIPRATTPPIIDGMYESLWDSARYSTIEAYYGGTIDDSLDFSARWKAMWDTTNIYFFTEVTDDTLFNYGSGAVKFWIHDCVEIFFDLLNDKDGVETGTSDKDDNYQYRFIWNLDDEPIFENPPTEGIENVSYSRIDGENTLGYNMEVKIPWATFIGVHTFGDVIVGRSVGLEFKIADLDADSVPDAVWWPDAELCWNNDTRDGLKVSSNFGTIVLVNDLLPDGTPPAAIDDLAGIPKGSSKALLNWTSTGDDGKEGLATGYEIRFNTDSISDANWDVSSLADTVPIPLISGTGQFILLTDLPKGTNVYFAIKTIDESWNYAPLSNVIKVRTFDPDLVAPSQITDLTIDSLNAFSVYLSWTAPGDDGTTGTAVGYEIRYNTVNINESNWNASNVFLNTLMPTEFGAAESLILDMLAPESTYYFAIRAYDEEPNTGLISNVVSATTLEFIPSSQPKMDEFIGTNAFIDDPLDKMLVAGFIREYHPWNWDEGGIWMNEGNEEYIGYPNNQNAWSPSYAGGCYVDGVWGTGCFDYDAYYKKLFSAGITVCPAVMDNVTWLPGTGSDKPLDEEGLDPEDAHSYKAHADHIFQYAARYGSAEVHDSLLKLAPNQERVSGLGVLRYLENWNEPDRDWAGRASYFSPEELAAMCSADYDGHEGSMGETFGVKNADPNMKLSLGGLVNIDVDYVKAMSDWFDENRSDGVFAADVINVHHYTNHLSPEADGLRERLMAMTDYRDRYHPDVEVWITEFGWDTGDLETSYSAPRIGSLTREEVQAMWLVRSYLIISSTGVDKAAMFMLRDVQNNGSQAFNTCGLVNQKNDWTPKPSWYSTYTLKNVLTRMHFTGIHSTGHPDVWAYKYTNDSGDTTAIAIWAPTSDGTLVKSYNLSLPAGTKSASKVEIEQGSVQGIGTEMTVSRNTVTLDVVEEPVFIVTTTNTTGINDRQFSENEIHIYPNPAADIIRIGSKRKISGNYTIYIRDISGKVVLERSGSDLQANHQLNISSLSEGIYFVEMDEGNLRSMAKFIIYK